MNFRLLTLTAVFALSLAAHADDSFHRTLKSSSSPDVYVSTGSGSVHIHPGSNDTVEVTGRVHASWGAFGDVRSRVDRIVNNPPITQSGNSIRIGEPNDRSLFNNISIDYEITVPANVALNLHTGSGDIEVDNAGRFLAASSGSGSVRGHQIHGPAELETGSGDIEVENTASGDVKAKTGSGSIRLHGLEGSLYARAGSGDIQVDGHLVGASNLTSGSGSVRLHLTPDSHFNLEAATGSGDIRVQMPGYTQSNSDGSRHHLTTSVNGGGEPLSIRTGSGDIEVSQR